MEDHSSDSGACESTSDSGKSSNEGCALMGACALHHNTLFIAPVASARGKTPKIHTVVDERPDAYVTECGKEMGLAAERMVGWALVIVCPIPWCPLCKSKLPEDLLAFIEADF